MHLRMHNRICVELPASFSGPSYHALGTVVSLSLFGCRARTKHIFEQNETVGVLIEVPGHKYPLYITQAQIRWSDGYEFGMEIISIKMEDRHRLSELMKRSGGLRNGEQKNPKFI
jgi:hypothetical protein